MFLLLCMFCFLVHVLVYHLFLPTSYALISSDRHHFKFTWFSRLTFLTTVIDFLSHSKRKKESEKEIGTEKERKRLGERERETIGRGQMWKKEDE